MGMPLIELESSTTVAREKNTELALHVFLHLILGQVKSRGEE